jgi:hypothetical protein
MAAWIAAEILRWTSGDGCARTTMQAARKTEKELARDKNIIIRRRKKQPIRQGILYHSLTHTTRVTNPDNTQEELTRVEKQNISIAAPSLLQVRDDRESPAGSDGSTLKKTVILGNQESLPPNYHGDSFRRSITQRRFSAI